MSDNKAVKELIAEQPEGEVKEVLKDGLKLVQELDKAQAEYNQLSPEERKHLPESVHEFFNMKQLKPI